MEEARLLARDGFCNGKEIHHASARFNALASRRCATPRLCLSAQLRI